MNAIRKLAYEGVDNGLIALELTAGIGRVRGAKRQGIRAGNWLTPAEATALLNAPDRGSAIGCRGRACSASCWVAGCGAPSWSRSMSATFNCAMRAG